MEEVVLSFGKFSGKSIEEIPSKYLFWLLEQDWFETKYSYLVEPVEFELDWRTRMDRHFEDEFSG